MPLTDNIKRLPKLCDPLDCTGCGACASICPVDAIAMTPGTDGFVRPVIDTGKCIRCLSCERTCPVLQTDNNSTNCTEPQVFACWNKDAESRAESSSGGAFSALATAVFSRGGHVAGAVYDENMKPVHKLCRSIEDLPRLRGSKYVQSEIGDVFREIRQDLQAGIEVLFVGTPCQVAGLRSYLKKDYANLICCDIICHGTPSPLLFRKYLDWVEAQKSIEVTAFNFRDKKSGWYDAVRMANHDVCMKGKYDSYFFGFNRNISLRESCYRCPAIGLPRKGDLTIADYWGVGMKYKFENINEIPDGISLIMANDDKGMNLFESAKMYLNWRKGYFDEALCRNQPMIKPSSRPTSRDTFYRDMESMDYEQLRQKYFKISGKAKLIASFREYFPRFCVTGLRKMMQIIAWRKNGSKSV